MAYPMHIKDEVKRLFVRGLKPSEIQQQLNITSTRIINHWAKKECWGDLLAFDNPLNAVTRRINRLYEQVELLGAKGLNELDRSC